MIKITNLSKNYGPRKVLSNISFDFKEKGIYVIYGPSGSGKTTLLNCVAGLTDFSGSIQVNRQNVEALNDDDLSRLRLTTYGFVFQDFKLFETETVLANLLFPLDTLYSISKAQKIRKCRDLLALVGLPDKEKQNVNKLSGGEKQRVAIARSLINDPMVLLCDEPTGALDENTGNEIMSILKRISKRAIVIMVSHDQSLTKQYADVVIEMNEGKIVNVIKQRKDSFSESHLPVLDNGVSNDKTKISDSFLIRHTFHTMKQKKLRTGLCYTMTSMGLIGVGLAFALSSTIADNIKQAYREIVDENSIVVTLKDKNSSIQGQYAASFYEVNDIKETYPEYIDDIGATYYCNFEKFFEDRNELAFVKGYRRSVIPGFSARHINEFEWLEDINTKIYPKDIQTLNDDEVILSLDYATLRDLCFELQIDRNVNSLSNYLLSNTLDVYFDLANYSWDYTDEQLLIVKGFTLENSLKIYHSNHLWNEHMFEEMMRFPSNDALSLKDNEPWIMKKIYYLKAKENRDKLLNLFLDSEEMDKYIFEIADEMFYPWLYYGRKIEERNRIHVFINTIAHIPNWHVDYFMNNDNNLTSPIYGNNSGFLIYPESLMMGFSKTMYFSKDEDQINTVVDKFTSKNKDGIFEENLPDGFLSGNYAKSLQNGVRFETIEGKTLQKGNEPESLNEIAVSRAFAKECHIEDINEIVYVTTARREAITNNGGVISDYVVVPLIVTGLIDSNKNCIYHEKNWTSLFYQCKIGISAYELQTNSISFTLKDSKKIDESLKLFKKGFPNYNAVNPLCDVNDSVDNVCFYITIVLIIFSMVATLISILLLTICNYLYILEGRKDIALARCIGVNKKESRKFLYYHSLIQCFISFTVASVELFMFSFVANLEIGNALSTSSHFSFNPIVFLPMFALAFSIAIISSFFMSRRINKINPLEALKQ